MAILAIFTRDGLTKQMYEQLRKEVDWEHMHPTGLILHTASLDNSGNNIRVVMSGSLNRILITLLTAD